MATKVTIRFVTNRNHLPDNKTKIFGERFNEDGVAALRYGWAECSVDGRKASVTRAEVYPDAKVSRVFETVPMAGSGSFMEDLRQEMRNRRDTLIFIHGFNVSFIEAIESAALLAAGLAEKTNVVVFSWPSDGRAIPYMSYYSDREDARASGPALARAYLKLYDFIRELRAQELKEHPEDMIGKEVDTELCRRCIHVLAHSMGNYVLRQGIQAIRAKDPRSMVRMFDQVVMAAPDEDDDTFEHDDKLRVLPTISRRITVYHNQHDRALVISDRTKANPDRLGADGPRMLDLLPKKVKIVDCSRVASIADPKVRHSYYIRSPAVTRDLNQVLSDTPDEEIHERVIVRPERAYRLLD